MSNLSLFEILESLGLDEFIKGEVWDTEKADLLENPIELHIQPAYPLKGAVANARVLNGRVSLAASETCQYGEKAAWDSEYE